jgi:hypothetical protein
MNPDMSETEKFFGFSSGASSEKKVATVKKKIEKIKKIEKLPNKTPEQQREIDFFERLGMPQSITSDPNRKKIQDEESEKALLASLKKMGIIG